MTGAPVTQTTALQRMQSPRQPGELATILGYRSGYPNRENFSGCCFVSTFSERGHLPRADTREFALSDRNDTEAPEHKRPGNLETSPERDPAIVWQQKSPTFGGSERPRTRARQTRGRTDWSGIGTPGSARPCRSGFDGAIRPVVVATRSRAAGAGCRLSRRRPPEDPSLSRHAETWPIPQRPPVRQSGVRTGASPDLGSA